MAPEDEEKMAFWTLKGMYCYKVMPFGLKNEVTLIKGRRFLMICFINMLNAMLMASYGEVKRKIKPFARSSSGI
jgi:hypothetical protein